LAILKPDFENLASFKRVWLFQKPKKARRNLAFFVVFGFISKIKKARRNLFFSGFFLVFFQNNTTRIYSLRQCDPPAGSVM